MMDLRAAGQPEGVDAVSHVDRGPARRGQERRGHRAARRRDRAHGRRPLSAALRPDCAGRPAPLLRGGPAPAEHRRLGPRSLAGRIVGRQIIDWSDVQYLASAAPVQLKVSYDRLADLNPVDLARIVDALSFRESAEIVAALDEETAAETLEEVSDE